MNKEFRIRSVPEGVIDGFNDLARDWGMSRAELLEYLVTGESSGSTWVLKNVPKAVKKGIMNRAGKDGVGKCLAEMLADCDAYEDIVSRISEREE